MNIVFKQLFSACALIVFLTPAARAVDFPVPDFFKLSVVAEDMSYSGVALSVSQFNSSKSVADIRLFYESSWPQTRVVEHDRMFVLSHLDEKRGLLFSVQIEGDWRRQGRPEGYLAVSDLPAYLSGNKSDLPKKGENFPVHVTGGWSMTWCFMMAAKKAASCISPTRRMPEPFMTIIRAAWKSAAGLPSTRSLTPGIIEEFCVCRRASSEWILP